MNNNEPRLEALVEEIRNRGTHTDTNCLKIGGCLRKTKEIIGHGCWERWFRMQNFSFSLTTAKRLTRIAKGVENRPLLAELGIAKADALLRLDDNEYDKFISENNVKELSVSTIEYEIRKIIKSSSNQEAESQPQPEKEEEEIEPTHASSQMSIEELRDYINAMIEKYANEKDTAIGNLRTLFEEGIEKIEAISESF